MEREKATKTPYFSLLLLCAMSGLLSSIGSAQVYELKSLPFQFPYGINDSGAIIGSDGTHAYLWENEASIGIGGLYPGGASLAHGLNNSKQVVGYAPPGLNQNVHAFLWQNFVMTDLGIVSNLYSEATCINDSGEIAGNAFDTTGAHPFFWKNGVAIDMATPGNQGSGAAGINNMGQVVGSSRLNDTTVHAYVWQNGGVTDLGTFGGGTYSEARAINNIGQIVGSSSLDGPSGTDAILWDGGLTDLGYIGIPGNASGWSVANDINDAGVVVGQSTWASPTYQVNTHAFVWRNGVMTDLNTVTDTTGGWELVGGTGINNQGDILCQAVQRAYPNFVQSVLLKRGDIFLKDPASGVKWISGDIDTIRWRSGLDPGEKVILWYSLNGGQTWRLIETNYPADEGKYLWSVPDTISTKVRILVTSASDFSKNDTSEIFKIKGYVLTKMSPTDDYIPYSIQSDRWGFGNTPLDCWPQYWYHRFDYTGVDPFTGGSYLLGENFAAEVFLNAHPADHPDWPSFVNTFGVDASYVKASASLYSPTAVARWEGIKGNWGGSCFGISTSNAIAFRNQTNFRNKYADFPFYVSANEVGSDTNTLPVINELFTHQFGNPHQAYNDSRWESMTPTLTVNELKSMLLSDDAPVRTLNIYNNGPDGGGHSILPYKLKQDAVQRNLYYLSVYDNSYPDVLDAQITIDTAQNSGHGSWEYPLWLHWGGNRGIYLADPAIDYLSHPTLPKNNPAWRASPFVVPPNLLEINPVRSASIHIRDIHGYETGYSDSVILAGIPGSRPDIILNGSTTPPYGYTLPDSAYSVSMSNFSSEISRIFFFVEDKTFGVERTGATQGQTDKIYFNGGVSVANPDTDAKTLRFVNILNQFVHQGQEKVFSLRSLTLSANDSVRMENTANDGIKFSSFGSSARTYKLELELDNYFTGRRRFAHDLVQLAGNSSHIIQPNWSTLGNGDLKILVDHGNDGTIDDSLLVSNQVTGVKGRGSFPVPGEYRLAQNYPNPFNPRTTIEYDLPARSHVRVAIYDLFGREVAVLVDGSEDAGYKSVEWNAVGVASGVYFCRLQAGDVTLTRKLVLMK